MSILCNACREKHYMYLIHVPLYTPSTCNVYSYMYTVLHLYMNTIQLKYIGNACVLTWKSLLANSFYIKYNHKYCVDFINFTSFLNNKVHVYFIPLSLSLSLSLSFTCTCSLEFWVCIVNYIWQIFQHACAKCTSLYIQIRCCIPENSIRTYKNNVKINENAP